MNHCFLSLHRLHTQVCIHLRDNREDSMPLLPTRQEAEDHAISGGGQSPTDVQDILAQGTPYLRYTLSGIIL